MRRLHIALLTVLVALPLTAVSATAAPQEDPGAIWCIESATARVGQREIHTPVICVPGP